MLYCKRSRTYINHSSAYIVNMNLRNVQNISLSQYLFNYVRSIIVWWYTCEWCDGCDICATSVLNPKHLMVLSETVFVRIYVHVFIHICTCISLQCATVGMVLQRCCAGLRCCKGHLHEETILAKHFAAQTEWMTVDASSECEWWKHGDVF